MYTCSIESPGESVTNHSPEEIDSLVCEYEFNRAKAVSYMSQIANTDIVLMGGGPAYSRLPDREKILWSLPLLILAACPSVQDISTAEFLVRRYAIPLLNIPVISNDINRCVKILCGE